MASRTSTSGAILRALGGASFRPINMYLSLYILLHMYEYNIHNPLCSSKRCPSAIIITAHTHYEDRRARMLMIARSKATTAFFRASYHEHTGASVVIVRVGVKSWAYYHRWQFFDEQKGTQVYITPLGRW